MTTKRRSRINLLSHHICLDKVSPGLTTHYYYYLIRQILKVLL